MPASPKRQVQGIMSSPPRPRQPKTGGPLMAGPQTGGPVESAPSGEQQYNRQMARQQYLASHPNAKGNQPTGPRIGGMAQQPQQQQPRPQQWQPQQPQQPMQQQPWQGGGLNGFVHNQIGQGWGGANGPMQLSPEQMGQYFGGGLQRGQIDPGSVMQPNQQLQWNNPQMQQQQWQKLRGGY